VWKCGILRKKRIEFKIYDRKSILKESIGIFSNGDIALPVGVSKFQIWDVEIETYKIYSSNSFFGGQTTSLAILNDQRVIIGNKYGELEIWNPKTETQDYSVQAHTSMISEIIVLSDEEILSKTYNEIRIHYLYNNLGFILVKETNTKILCTLAVGNRVITGNENHILKIWNIDNKQLEFTQKMEIGPITSMALLPNNEIICGSKYGGISIFNLNTYHIRFILQNNTKEITSIHVLPNYQILFVSKDQTIKIIT
jgi:WD40 repeat protein